jgi:uncharacterized cupin superfamily protein
MEDEFLMVVDGELMLVEDGGETLMGPGDCAAFKAGTPNAHRMVNRSDQQGRFLVIGTRGLGRETCHYPDVGLKVVIEDDKAVFSDSSGRLVREGG